MLFIHIYLLEYNVCVCVCYLVGRKLTVLKYIPKTRCLNICLGFVVTITTKFSPQALI